MKDILASYDRAMLRDGWLFGDKGCRIGNPFAWTESERKGITDLEGLRALLFFYKMYYVEPQDFIEIDRDVLLRVGKGMLDVIRQYLPFADVSNNISCQALARAQDYAVIKAHCGDTFLSHVDVGPGLGASVLWEYGENYTAVEASPMSYGVQRLFYRGQREYEDTIVCEDFGEKPLVSAEILHVPSWNFHLVRDDSADLVTATFVLNELNYAGILWILCNISRITTKGGYVYIRDSDILKPGMHDISNDKALIDMGFECTYRLKYTNRHDYFGIPRVYRKATEKVYTFETLVDKYLGKHMTVSGGDEFKYNEE